MNVSSCFIYNRLFSVRQVFLLVVVGEGEDFFEDFLDGVFLCRGDLVEFLLELGIGAAFFSQKDVVGADVQYLAEFDDGGNGTACNAPFQVGDVLDGDVDHFGQLFLGDLALGADLFDAHADFYVDLFFLFVFFHRVPL